MTARDRTTLKAYFETGKQPTESQFADVIDSFVSTTEDGSICLDRGTFANLDLANAAIGGEVPANRTYLAIVGADLYLARAGDTTYIPANSLTALQTAYESAAELQADATLTLGQQHKLVDGTVIEKVIPAVRVQFTVQTTAADEVFTLPLQDNGEENYQIDWGDGTEDTGFTTHNDARLAHTYATAGDYVVKLRGTNACIHFNNGGDRLKVMGAVEHCDLDALNVADASGMWRGCANITSINTTRMKGITVANYFAENTAITTVDLSSMESLQSARFMFHDCSSLVTVAGFNTVITLVDAFAMFDGCSSLTTQLDFQYFADLVDAGAICQGCTSLTSVIGLGELASLRLANAMFSGCTLLTSFPEFYGMASLENAQGMFGNTAITGTMNLTGAVSLTNGSYMFYGSPITGIIMDGVNCANWTEVVGDTSITSVQLDAHYEWLDANGPATGTFGNQLLDGRELDSARSVAGLAAVTSLLGKGWTRSGAY